MPKTKRVAIVGGSAVGSETAYALLRFAKTNNSSVHVDIYEKNTASSHRPVCTGLFTTAIGSFFDRPFTSYPFLKNTLTEVSLCTGDTKNPSLNVPLTEYLVDRTAFDLFVRKRAQQAGATIHYSECVEDITTLDDQTLALTIHTKNKGNKTVEYDTVIVATGISHPTINGTVQSRPPLLTGAQYRITLSSPYPSPYRFECHFLQNNTDFFYWVVPEDEFHLRIGTAAQKDVRCKLDPFLKQWKKKHSVEVKKATFQAAPIPLYEKRYKKKLRPLEHKKIYFIGDAGADIKNTTGGGIVPAFQNAHRFAEWYCSHENHMMQKIQSNIHSQMNRFYQEQQLSLHHLIMQRLQRSEFRIIENLNTKLSHPKTKKILSRTSRDKVISLALQLVVYKPSLLTTFFSRDFNTKRHRKN